MTKRSLRLCMLSDDFLPAATGVGSHLQAVTALLAARGHQVSVITTRRSGQPVQETWQGVKVLRLVTVKVFGFYQAIPSQSTLDRVIGELQPDLVHHHYLGLMFLRALQVAKRLGLPQVYTYHMTEDHLTQPWPLRPMRPVFAKAIIRYCNQVDQVVSVSSNLARRIVDKGVTVPVQYISNPVHFPPYSGHGPDSTDGVLRVLFAGRLNPEKNIPYLLRGFARLLVSVPNAVLHIAGAGSQQLALKRLVTELGITSSVQFLGFLSHADLTHEYTWCDVFVLPSWVETQGLVAMEAMHHGRPLLVATSVVSADELVDDGGNGYLIDPDSVDDLGRRLIELARDPALRRRMGLAGLAKAEHFKPGRVIDELEAMYCSVLEPTRRVAVPAPQR